MKTYNHVFSFKINAVRSCLCKLFYLVAFLWKVLVFPVISSVSVGTLL